MAEPSPSSDPLSAFGPNEWLVDELYEQFKKDRNSVDKAWWDFFKDYAPGEGHLGRDAAVSAQQTNDNVPAAGSNGSIAQVTAAPSAPATAPAIGLASTGHPGSARPRAPHHRTQRADPGGQTPGGHPQAP